MKWRQVKIGDLGRVVTGKTPPTKQRQYYDGEYPFVTPSDLDYDTYRITQTETTLSDEAKAKYPNQFLPANAVSFTCIASVGKIGVTTEESLTNQQINSVIVQDTHDWRFVYYLLRNNAKRILGMCSGVATPIINKGDFEKVQVTIPDVRANEEAIAAVLSAYDELIENNRRRIQLLEQAARLLYKEWFVHLRFPGHEHTRIIDGVPEGWEKGVVSDFYDTASGGTPSRKNPEFYSGTIRWVKTQELQDGFLFDTEEHITEDAIKKSAAKLFPANTVLIAMYGATIGQVGVIVEPSTCNQACCAVMPKAEGTSYEHAFLFFLSNKDGLRNLGQGAAQKNISQQVIRAYEMVLPDKLVLNMFRIYAEPFLSQIRTLQAMNNQLAKARDLLLPKLMNGEIAV